MLLLKMSIELNFLLLLFYNCISSCNFECPRLAERLSTQTLKKSLKFIHSFGLNSLAIREPRRIWPLVET